MPPRAQPRLSFLRRAVLGGLVVLGFSGYALRQRGDFSQLFREGPGDDGGRVGLPNGNLGTVNANAFTPPATTTVPQTTAPSTTAPSVPSSPTPTTPTQSSSGLKDGTYTGPVTDAYYGQVQIQATVQGGRITDVRFLQYPSDRRTSQQINSVATPMLSQEAISAQSANVDIVSGATLTSLAFQQSLASALQQAGG